MQLLYVLWFLISAIIENISCDHNSFEHTHDVNNDDYLYDHNSILKGEEARKFDKLTPEESKIKFGEIIDRMDINHDGFIDMTELKDWIGNLYNSTLNDDVEAQWNKMVPGNMDKIDFEYYVSKTFGKKRTEDHLKLIKKEQRRWHAADLDKDDTLNKTELFRFLHPEEFKDLKPLIAQETLEEMDLNKDSVIDVNEYLKDMFPEGTETKEEWIRNERQNFGIDRDLNKDGVMDRDEIQKWLLPDSYNRVDSEARHLMELADQNRDQFLSKKEMLDKYYVFVGSQTENFEHYERSHEDL